MDSEIKELVWRFVFQDGIGQEIINSFIERFVDDFVAENGWYCGGGQGMAMYDLENQTSLNGMRSKLVEYLGTESAIVKAIVVQKYDSQLDDFVDSEYIEVNGSFFLG